MTSFLNDCCTAISGTPQLSGMRKLHSEKVGWVGLGHGSERTCRAGIIDAAVLEEGCHREVLVVGAPKVGRETTTREVTCDLGCIVLHLVLRTADN